MPLPAETNPAHAPSPLPESRECWLRRQTADLRREIGDCQREIATLRQYESRRAAIHWEDDRRAEVERIGQALRRRPALTRARLLQSSHGCRWLLERWHLLRAIALSEGTWNDAQRGLAQNLLGIPTELQCDAMIDAAGGPLAFADRSIAEIEGQLNQGLDELDAMEQSFAEAGHPVEASPAMKRLMRQESALWQRLMRLERQIKAASEAPDEAPSPVPSPSMSGAPSSSRETSLAKAPRPERMTPPIGAESAACREIDPFTIQPTRPRAHLDGEGLPGVVAGLSEPLGGIGALGSGVNVFASVCGLRQE